MKQRTLGRSIGAIALAGAFIAAPLTAAQAYSPAGGVVYQVPADQDCLKGRGNCAIYGKMAQLPSGRLLMSFEQSTVVAETGTADGQTLPVYKSDDYGDTWQKLSDVAAPAYLSDDPRFAPYVSNWTNPNLYVLPETIGQLEAGTLLLASVVSGDDEYYKENKQRDPDWVPDNDGDRSNVSIALFASEDEGASWDVVDIIAEGGWQGGSAGAGGRNIATANVHRQVDPVWEPYLMAHDGELLAFYSDESDHLPFDPATGRAIEAPDNDTAADSRGQILVHRSWDGTDAGWSDAVVDVPGITETAPSGSTQIGGGRPGMTYVAPTTDGRWLITFEYFGGGSASRFAYADDPRSFRTAVDEGGQPTDALPVTPGSGPLAGGGSPVTEVLPDGRIVYNAAGSGSVWVNESGRSDGAWTEYNMPVGGGYSRALQYVEGTGRVLTSQSVWGSATGSAIIRHAEVDLGDSVGAYYRLVNEATGQVLGTGGRSNDARFNNWTPDVRLEEFGSAADADTQYWRLVRKDDGNHVLLNKAGGRHASVWGATAAPGTGLAQWVDEYDDGVWTVVEGDDGTIALRSVNNPAMFATGASADGAVTTEVARTDGSQRWRLEPLVPDAAQLADEQFSAALIDGDTVESGGVVSLDAAAFLPSGAPLRAGVAGLAVLYAQDGVRELGRIDLDGEQRGEVALPDDLDVGEEVRLAVLFNDSAPVWDTAVVAAVAVDPEPQPEPQPSAPGTTPSQGGAPNATGGDPATVPTGDSAGALPRTGAELGGPLAAALAAVALGSVLLLRRLRNRSGAEQHD